MELTNSEILGRPNIERALNKVLYNLSLIKLIQTHLKLSQISRSSVAEAHLRAQSFLNKMLELRVNSDPEELFRLWSLYKLESDKIKNIIV